MSMLTTSMTRIRSIAGPAAKSDSITYSRVP
jgi:hypothetical protein